jgi:hypothetical protein
MQLSVVGDVTGLEAADRCDELLDFANMTILYGNICSFRNP